MYRFSFSFLSLLFCCVGRLFAISLTPQEAQSIGERIWQNECGGKFQELTHWNKGEGFASLGIGHFIWFPVNHKEPFKETFPLLLDYLKKEEVQLPQWLYTAQGCPWRTREDFYHHFHSPEMNQLRQFLYDTRNYQTIFIANRLEKVLPELIFNCTESEQRDITTTFLNLASTPQGLFALIDYLNFKGAGTSPTETYAGVGWGLLHVLKRIPPDSTNPLLDFVHTATALLKQRVQNAPPERNEERWLKGWLNRLNSYLQ